ncbi:site-2 protease family protein [Vulgatibacter incomptus]|uniref:Zinc metalloprotease n=1 Tax=Vulgatibacter incomptus TaxID=1391653 RepID=A0A0K1PH26_9BACT|nr:site-2 protease family protein [Vulgatibacter incomptus]AKU92424.1 Stage IV sporulation pro-sigma-K processing enzyme (SpoIVFB) [Vulgatibacter incomptus]
MTVFKRGAITVLTVKGVPIRLHFSVLLLIPVLTYALAVQMPRVAAAAKIPTESLGLPGWAWGLLASIGLIVSITLHELAHTLVAMKYGGKVDSIVLMALGGVSQITQMPKRPTQELVMAAVGPALSVVLGVVLGLGWKAFAASPNLAFYFFMLGYLNLVLGVFNFIPAFPMDGGRVLRAALATRMGKYRATNVAAVIGKALAVAFAVFGVFGGGIWMILIAFFVWSGATQEKLYSDLQHALGHVRVGEVQSFVPQVESDSSLEEARLVLREAGADSAIVEEHGQTVGLVRKLDILSHPPDERMKLRVSACMIAAQPLTSSEELGDSFDRVLREGELPVVDPDGNATGLIRSQDIIDTLRSRGFHFPGDRKQPPSQPRP